MNQNYLSLNASLSEALATYFYREHGYIVQPFGIENIVGNTLYFLDTKNKNDLKKQALSTVAQCMTLPDLLVIKPSKNNAIQETYLVEVKYREYKDYDSFKKSYTDKDGDLQQQAYKYLNNWGTVHMFLIIKFRVSSNTIIYLSTAEQLSKGYLHKLDNTKHNKWVNEKIKTKVLSRCNNIFNQ